MYVLEMSDCGIVGIVMVIVSCSMNSEHLASVARSESVLSASPGCPPGLGVARLLLQHGSEVCKRHKPVGVLEIVLPMDHQGIRPLGIHDVYLQVYKMEAGINKCKCQKKKIVEKQMF